MPRYSNNHNQNRSKFVFLLTVVVLIVISQIILGLTISSPESIADQVNEELK